MKDVIDLGVEQYYKDREEEIKRKEDIEYFKKIFNVV